jgi:arylsulfatase A-like enzyme
MMSVVAGRTPLLFLLAASLAACGPGRGSDPDRRARGAGSGAERPNIVVILADDLGFSDIGVFGAEIETPSLDALAAEGLRFTQFYNTARCTPTRASLLTGLYPHQAGLGHMPDGYAARVRATFNSPAYTDHLSPATPTIAEVLRSAGYATYMTGKWHLGYHPSQWPAARGFDRSFSAIDGALNYWGYGVQMQREVREPLMALDDQLYIPPREGFFTTDAFTDHAVRYIEEHDATRPFFLYVAYTAPHWPLQAPPDDIAKYRGRYAPAGWDRLRRERYDRLIGSGIIDPAWPLAPRPEGVPAWEGLPPAQRDQWDHEMAIYAAQIDRMDAGVGRILEALRRGGHDHNTIVLFLSDNGGAAEDPNGSLEGALLGGRDSFEGYGIRGAHVSSGPFRLTKKWVHEGGIATPFIVRWPARVGDDGALRHEPAHIIDLFPTFLDVAQATMPRSWNERATVSPEGASLLPVLAGGTLPERALFWEHEGNRAVRQGRWKLVSQFPGNWELYDLVADRTELQDLAGRYPERVDAMAELYRAWAERAGAQPWSLLGQ